MASPFGFTRPGTSTRTDYTPSTDYGDFNIAPSPMGGQGPYGTVPGIVETPPNLWEQMKPIYPVASQATAISPVIGAQIAGTLTPEEIATYQTLKGQFGAAMGQPLSNFAGRAGLMKVGRDVSETQQLGITNFQNMLRALGGTLTPQELQYQIASRNAAMRAAPDPAAAAAQQMADWMEKFNAQQRASQTGGPTTRPSGGSYITPPSPTGPSRPSGQPEVGGGIPVAVGGTGPFYDPSGAYKRWEALMGSPQTWGNTRGGGGYDTWTGSMSGDYLAGLGLDPTGYSQDDLDLMAYMYGYSGEQYGAGPGVQPTSSGYMYIAEPYDPYYDQPGVESTGYDVPAYDVPSEGTYDPYYDQYWNAMASGDFSYPEG